MRDLLLFTSLGFKRKKKPTRIAARLRGGQHPHLFKGNPARIWGESIAIATALGVGINATSDSILVVDSINCKGTTYFAAA